MSSPRRRGRAPSAPERHDHRSARASAPSRASARRAARSRRRSSSANSVSLATTMSAAWRARRASRNGAVLRIAATPRARCAIAAPGRSPPAAISCCTTARRPPLQPPSAASASASRIAPLAPGRMRDDVLALRIDEDHGDARWRRRCRCTAPRDRRRPPRAAPAPRRQTHRCRPRRHAALGAGAARRQRLVGALAAGAVEKSSPGTVSPGFGMRLTVPMRSRLIEPKTVIMRCAFTIVFQLRMVTSAPLSQRLQSRRRARCGPDRCRPASCRRRRRFRVVVDPRDLEVALDGAISASGSSARRTAARGAAASAFGSTSANGSLATIALSSSTRAQHDADLEAEVLLEPRLDLAP